MSCTLALRVSVMAVFMAAMVLSVPSAADASPGLGARLARLSATPEARAFAAEQREVLVEGSDATGLSTILKEHESDLTTDAARMMKLGLYIASPANRPQREALAESSSDSASDSRVLLFVEQVFSNPATTDLIADANWVQDRPRYLRFYLGQFRRFEESDVAPPLARKFAEELGSDLAPAYFAHTSPLLVAGLLTPEQVAAIDELRRSGEAGRHASASAYSLASSCSAATTSAKEATRDSWAKMLAEIQQFTAEAGSWYQQHKTWVDSVATAKEWLGLLWEAAKGGIRGEAALAYKLVTFAENTGNGLAAKLPPTPTKHAPGDHDFDPHRLLESLSGINLCPAPENPGQDGEIGRGAPPPQPPLSKPVEEEAGAKERPSEGGSGEEGGEPSPPGLQWTGTLTFVENFEFPPYPISTGSNNHVHASWTVNSGSVVDNPEIPGLNEILPYTSSTWEETGEEWSDSLSGCPLGTRLEQHHASGSGPSWPLDAEVSPISLSIFPDHYLITLSAPEGAYTSTVYLCDGSAYRTTEGAGIPDLGCIHSVEGPLPRNGSRVVGSVEQAEPCQPLGTDPSYRLEFDLTVTCPSGSAPDSSWECPSPPVTSSGAGDRTAPSPQ